jgi:hypothetical protein
MIRLYLLILPPFGWNSDEFFTVGKIYEGDFTPTEYDHQTLKPAPPSYVVKCNDDKWRKVPAEYFITLEEWRERQLNELDI